MRAPLRISFILAVAAVLAAACSGASGGKATSGPAQSSGGSSAGSGALTTTTLRYDGGTISIEVADTPEARAKGLGERDSLPSDAGMLFDLESTGPTSFWMKGMRFALDMVWIDADKRVAGVTANVEPQPNARDDQLRLYPSPVSTRYVLELNAGAAGDRGLATGSQLAFSLP